MVVENGKQKEGAPGEKKLQLIERFSFVTLISGSGANIYKFYCLSS